MKRYFQSRGAGFFSAEVKRIGRSTVPSAISVPST
jgi:hypothetical protein